MKRKQTNWFRFYLVLILCTSVALLTVFSCLKLSEYLHPTCFIASEQNTIEISIPYKKNGEIEEEIITLPRGTEVQLRDKGNATSTVRYDGVDFVISNEYLSDNLDGCVQIDYVYPRRLVTLRDEKGGKLSKTVAQKGEQLEVVKVSGKDLDVKTGVVKWYQVKKGENTYWISGYYTETSEKLATENHAQSVIYSTYWDAYYGEGYSKDAYITQVDYKPFMNANYEDNPLITDINSVHVSLEYLMTYKEYYLDLINTTGVNSLCVEVKGDGGYLWYESDVPKRYMKDTSKALGYVMMSQKEMKALFREFQDAGFYIIARIVTFKDGIYAENNVSQSLTDANGELLLHNEEYWPSAYSRDAWMYNVDIAKEVAQCCVNEIQFDYVRFPDGTLQQNLDGSIDFKNTYNESKVAALQAFLMYAKEEISQYEVYISADLFAWPIVAEDDQDIGQFLPADATVLDVVSPMPYTDHFSAGAMNIADPTSEPEETLYQFSTRVKRQMDKIETNCIYRTWIQAYGGFTKDDVIAEIKGINRAGYEGYIVWYGNGSPDSIGVNKDGYIDSSLDKTEE